MRPEKRVIPVAFAVVLMSGITAAAQTDGQSTTPAGLNSVPAAVSSKQDATDSSSYSTGKPLEMQSKEGFWGHVNPFARKKWVKREMDPVRDRVNELDQLQAKNANDIRDVDSRATTGIKRANDAAVLADQHAASAASRADAANNTATTASTRTDALHGTVRNIDQYQTVQSTPVAFAAGRITLGPKGKADLDDVAGKLAAEKGYILEVQGYSRSGVATSQAMADSVVRYLVIEHQVPVYRIYRSGMGKANAKSTPDGERVLSNGVRVTLLHNSLSTMDSTAPKTTFNNDIPSSFSVGITN